MPRGWVCPGCRHSNTWVEKTCTECGAPKPAKTASPRTEKEPDLSARCAFITFDRRCPMFAAWYEEKQTRGYCTWHAVVIRDPRANIFEEFARFVTKLRGPDELEMIDHETELAQWVQRIRDGKLEPAFGQPRIPPRYCTTFTHHPPGHLWDYLEAGGQGILPAPRPCYSPSCPYAAVEVTEEQVAQFRAAVREGGFEHALSVVKGSVRR